ncbi:hypothetical protein N7535_009267 [Penicillium sp. DV-2018c]|nr:hypothetical protein N7461_002823 [Penicillium sp. DV-2018c]KAJ5561070.1 hypothetical protein N7535_009267 [Penicillium sp. DV-2018c]
MHLPSLVRMTGRLERKMAASERDPLLRNEAEDDNNREGPHELRDTDTQCSSWKHAISLDSSVLRVVKSTLGCSYANLLLPFVSLGIIAGSQGWGDLVSFACNFLAIFPLAALLSFATEELAKSVGKTVAVLAQTYFSGCSFMDKYLELAAA